MESRKVTSREAEFSWFALVSLIATFAHPLVWTNSLCLLTNPSGMYKETLNFHQPEARVSAENV